MVNVALLEFVCHAQTTISLDMSASVLGWARQKQQNAGTLSRVTFQLANLL